MKRREDAEIFDKGNGGGWSFCGRGFHVIPPSSVIIDAIASRKTIAIISIKSCSFV